MLGVHPFALGAIPDRPKESYTTIPYNTFEIILSFNIFSSSELSASGKQDIIFSELSVVD